MVVGDFRNHREMMDAAKFYGVSQAISWVLGSRSDSTHE